MMKKINNAVGFSEELNFAHFIDEGVIINKDGAFLVTYQYSGPDIESATSSELDNLADNFNRMMTFLEDGWMLHVDELRIPSVAYPKQGAFPDSVSCLIDDERRQLYEAEGAHFENLQFLTFVWKFPMQIVKTTKHWFVSGLESEKDDQNLSSLYSIFSDAVDRCINVLSSQLSLEKLNSADLLSFLNTCITGDLLPVSVPPQGCYLDVALSRKPVTGGFHPTIGNKIIRVISLTDYLNHDTIPGMLDELGAYPLVYRWSNRFIPLSESTAEIEIKRYERNWHNKTKGLMGLLKEMISGKEGRSINQDAHEMCQQAQEAMRLNSGRSIRFGYLTSEIVLMHDDVAVLEQATQEIKKYLDQCGFANHQETANAFDAWLGTIPGHGICNARRLFVHSMNLAHLLPLHTIWADAATSHRASKLPPHSPPIFFGATTGKTPFRYHADVGDVGHTLVIGPTGTGKSTFLDLIISQFFRYENAKVFIFDNDYSHLGLTLSLSGTHYDIGVAEHLSFCPLADLSTESKKIRAASFIEMLVELQGVILTPAIRSSIYTAIESLSHVNHVNSRNMTVFRSEVQNESVREALQYYTINGQLKILDASTESLKIAQLQTFEMSWLLKQRPEIYLPVLKHLFDQIESFLEESKGKSPTYIILEEAYRYILNDYFSDKLDDWTLSIRKNNGRIVFITPTLSALYDPSSGKLNKTSAKLVESCYKKIFLPNSNIEHETRMVYQKMGLNDRQIELIEKIAQPKRHYYVVTPEGKRLIDLGFSDLKPMALNFLGLSKEDTALLVQCITLHGDSWVYHWLNQRGFSEWGKYWLNNYYSMRNVV